MTYVKALIYLKKGQHERLRELAYLKRTSISALVREAIDQFLAKKKEKPKEEGKE